MPSIVRQRDIIDRRALADQLSAAVPVVRSPALDRGPFVAPLKATLTKGHAEIRSRFEATGDGAAVMREQCFLMDQLIRVLFELVTGEIYPLPNPTSGERLAIVAVGGYGRGELAPYSDIDLLFLLPYKQTPHTEQVVEYLLYLLWDLGLKIGQATRSVEECLRQAKSDLTIRTGLLEARYLWGDQALFGDLKRRFDSDIVRGTAAQFVEAKLIERDARHQRVGDSRYQLEPNVKEGKGGLRDLHTLFWIAKYIYRTTMSVGSSSWACCRPRSRSVSTTPSASCGRFAAISITSPAAPKSGSLSTCRPKSDGGWATSMMRGAVGSSGS